MTLVAKSTHEEIIGAVQEEVGSDVRFTIEFPEGLGTPDVEIELYGEGLEKVDLSKLKNRLTQKVSRVAYNRPKLRVVVKIRDGRKEGLQRSKEELQQTIHDREREPKGSAQGAHYERVFQQWLNRKPAHWGNGLHTGERKMLAETIGDDEDIECLIGGSFGPDLGHASWKDGVNTLHSGIGVATNKRVLFLDKGLFLSKEVAELPYKSIEAITYSSGILFSEMRITGRGSLSLRIENINKRETKPFVDCVRRYLDMPEKVSVTAPISRVSELRELAELLREGIVTQAEFDAAKGRILRGE